MIDIELLSQICKASGAPGYEEEIRSLVARNVRDYCDELSVDNMGNLIAFKKGKKNKRLLLAAHMDEIGFVVSHIDKNGFVKFHPLGGFDPKTLTAQRVLIHGKETIYGVMGSKPIHIMTAEERHKAPKMDDFFIDTGRSAEELKSLIDIGDAITRERELVEMGDCVNSKSLDNRVSVFVLVEVLKKMKSIQPDYDSYFVFTVQEEVGLRGAEAVSSAINPDFGIAIDTTIAYDLPGSQEHEQVTSLGGGVAIKILDGRAICDSRMIKFLRSTADKEEIQWQHEVLPLGGTDTAAIQRSGAGGAIAGALSIPTRHIHQVIEMCHKQDILNCINLLSKSLSQMSAFDWEHKL